MSAMAPRPPWPGKGVIPMADASMYPPLDWNQDTNRLGASMLFRKASQSQAKAVKNSDCTNYITVSTPLTLLFYINFAHGK